MSREAHVWYIKNSPTTCTINQEKQQEPGSNSQEQTLGDQQTDKGNNFLYDEFPNT